MGVHFSACSMLARTKGVFKVSANQVRCFWGLGVPQQGFFQCVRSTLLRRAPSPPYSPLSLPRMQVLSPGRSAGFLSAAAGALAPL